MNVMSRTPRPGYDWDALVQEDEQCLVAQLREVASDAANQLPHAL